MMIVMESEIRAASRVERLEPVRRGPKVDKFGTRKKQALRILQDTFEVVWDQTRQRRKDEIQRCAQCGEISVWRGWKTGHEGAHAHWNGEREQ